MFFEKNGHIYSSGGHVLYNVGQAVSAAEGAKALAKVLQNGEAMEKFKAFIKAQGVASEQAEALCAKNADVFNVLPRAAFTTPVVAPDSGSQSQVYAVK